MNSISILIVDDEEEMRHLIQMYLENSGFHCYQAANGEETYQLLNNHSIDLILLDVMMPNESGFDVCEKIRRHSQVPIIFLSAKGEEWDKVKGLHLGGDDYIVKPFPPGELIARIQSLLRRTAHLTIDQDIVKMGKLFIHRKARKVMVDGETIPLTLKEFELLNLFINHPRQVLSREQILERIWGIDYQGSLRTVDTHIKTLRMKIGAEEYIQTVWGIGYKFEVRSE